MVPVIRSGQSPRWIWLVNYLHLHLHLQAAGLRMRLRCCVTLQAPQCHSSACGIIHQHAVTQARTGESTALHGPRKHTDKGAPATSQAGVASHTGTTVTTIHLHALALPTPGSLDSVLASRLRHLSPGPHPSPLLTSMIRAVLRPPCRSRWASGGGQLRQRP